MKELISIPELVELGVSKAKIWRKTQNREWEWTLGPSPGKEGLRRPKLILVSSLPSDLQIKWARLDSERRASAVTDSDSSVSRPVEEDDRLQKLQAALARFSPPEYTLDHRAAVERRAVELARLADETIELIRRLKSENRLTLLSPGAKEAGRDRVYDPGLAALANRAACSDTVFLTLYPSSQNPPSSGTWLKQI
jgi:hypothetical protein